MRLETFSLTEYRDLLTEVAEGRSCLCFGDFAPPAGLGQLQLRDGKEPPSRFLLLRHDVDFSPAGALRLARIEASMGLRATFFLPLTLDTYNLLCPAHRTLPRVLVELHHEVGLHYDVAVFEAEGSRTARQHLREQLDVLAGLAGIEVRSIAMHNPSLSGEDPFRQADDLVNAYDPVFTREMAYFSESCGAWRDNAYEALTRGRIPPRLQLLTHPVYWSEGPGDRRSRVREWAREQRAGIEEILATEELIWKSHSGVAEHERRRSQQGQ